MDQNPADGSQPSDLRERILGHVSPPITVAVGNARLILLRPATGNDMDHLRALLGRDLGAREFLVELMQHQWAGEASPGILLELEDDDLTYLTREWLKSVPGAEPGNVSSIDEAQVSVAAAYEAWMAPVRALAAAVERQTRSLAGATTPIRVAVSPEITRIAESLSTLSVRIAPHLEGLAESLRHLTDGIQNALPRFSIPALELARVFESLPYPEEIREAFEETRSGSEVLNELGYGYTIERWAPGYLRKIARGDVGRRAVHDGLRTYTRGDEFQERLKELITNSSTMRRRWRDLAPALGAHRERNYALSVPTLLAQLEGLITDLLVLRGRAVVVGRAVIEKDNGVVRRGRDGKPVRLKGLDSKSQRSRGLAPDELQKAAGFISDALVPQRNAILHGRKSGHGRAKLSVQLLLLIWIYAEVIAAAESSQQN